MLEKVFLILDLKAEMVELELMASAEVEAEVVVMEQPTQQVLHQVKEVLVAAMEPTYPVTQQQELQTLVAVVAAVVMLVQLFAIQQQVVQVTHELLIGVNYGTTLRIS
jgi:hypothetical protein